MSINKSWSAVIILFTLLLSGSFSPAVPPPQEPPQAPPISDEERMQLMEQLRERILNNQQQGQGRGQGRGFPSNLLQQIQQPATRPQTTASTAEPAPPQQISLTQANGKLQLVFKDADLDAFIQQISDLLNLTPLVVDPAVQGTVTIHSSAPMTKEEVLALFNLILKTKNASLIYQNGIYQVVPISSVLKTGVDLIEQQPPAVEQETTPETPQEQPPAAPEVTPAAETSQIPKLSTNVVPVEFIPVRDLIEPIKLFMTEGGVIMPYERLNMLILTDYDESIERILKVIHVLDNKFMDKDLIDLIEIHHNVSADISADLKKIFGDGTEGAATGVSFVSLDRLNAIFVMTSSKRALTEVKYWIDILDTKTGRTIQTNVYVVENSTASNIANLLYNLYGGEVTTQPATGAGAGAAAFPGGQQDTGLNQGRGSFGSFSTTGTFSNNNQGSLLGGLTSSGTTTFGNQQLNPQFNTTRTISSMVIEGGEFSVLQDTVRLVVDDISNRLIIQSTAADYEFVLEAIKLMDVMPRQVVIDARVFEVDLTDDLSFGVGAALRERTNGSITEVGLNTTSTEGVPTGALTAYNIALVGNSQELLTALNALREKTNVKILEAPSVLAMDGTQANITVGSQIPYTGSLYYQTNADNPTQSINYRDTGVTLYVLPRISASGSVTLEVLQEVSGLGTNTTLGPTFTQSKVQCTLTVKDGETVAIAGLIRESKSLTRSGFPLISDIPIIGSLFGQTNRNNRRSELIIMITPHVIKDADKFKEFTQEFKDSMRNVRRYADESDKNLIENQQSAIEDRKKAEEERLREEEQQRQREERAKQRTRE
jgi:general secretion pathway protein D